MSESKLSWVFLASALFAVAWGVWLKLNEPAPPEKTIEWVRRDGKLVERETLEPYQGVRQLAFDGAPEMVQWEYTYLDGIRQGPATEYYVSPDKRLKSRSTYIDGIPQGPVISYHSNGIVLSKGTAVDGLLNGLVEFYESDGTVRERFVYERSAPAGVPAVIGMPELSPEPESMADVDELEVDEPDPPLMLDPEGKPFSGTQLGTFFGGSKAFEHAYTDGREHGMHQGWEPGGDPEYERPYLHGKKHGTWKQWAENGELVSESTFQHGLQSGSAKTWFPNGQARQQSQFVHGAENGLRTNHDATGQLRRETTFDHGIQSHMKEWTEYGELTKDRTNPVAAGVALHIDPSEQSTTASVPITEFPDDLDGGTPIRIRYRVSSGEADPAADTARPFRVKIMHNGIERASYGYVGELGGWNFYQWLVNLSPGDELAVEVEASAGMPEIDLAGISFEIDPADVEGEGEGEGEK